MATERIEIIVEGRDQASGPLGAVGGALGNIAQIAGGIISANILGRIADGLSNLGGMAIDAVGQSQMLEMGLTSLLAKQKMYTVEGGKSVATGVALADAMQQAGGEARDLMAWTEKLAAVSPFETAQVQLVTRLGLAANMSTEGVKGFTKAFLDYSAVAGIPSSDLAFAADQFLQLRKIGQLNEIDLRQLRRLGIDVGQVLGVKMGMSVEQFNAQVKQSPELMDKLFESFVAFSSETTAGATDRMAKTIPGMMSTLHDLVAIGAKNLLQPIVEAVSPMMSDLLSNLTNIVTGPQMQIIGSLMGQTLSSALQGQWPAFQTNFNSLLQQLGVSPEAAAALSGALALALSGDPEKLKAAIMTTLDQIPPAISAWAATNGPILEAKGIEVWGWLTRVAIPDAGAKLSEMVAAISAWVSGPGQPQLQAAGETIGRGIGTWMKIEFAEGALAGQIAALIYREIPAITSTAMAAGSAIASGIIQGIAQSLLGKEAGAQLRGAIDTAVRGAMAGLNPIAAIGGQIQNLQTYAAPTGTYAGLRVPGRQFGGPVAGGQPYVVGERGPELFVPNQGGNVAPSGGAPQIIQLVVSGQVLAEVVTGFQNQQQRQAARMGAAPAL